MERPPASTRPAVADLLVRRPKTLPDDASVGDVRALLADDHVHMVLLVAAGRLKGTVVRGDVPESASTAEPALVWSRMTGRTVPPDADAETVRRRLVAAGGRRLAVVDDQGELLGLLCLKKRQTGFCSDADVANRRWCAEGVAG